MTSAPALRPGPLALVLSISIIFAWIASAIALDQSLFATQRSSQLLGIGALNGELLRTEGWWRLLASQYLHVHFPHMIFNAFGVLLIGSVVERSGGLFDLAIVYFLGGSVGQLVSVISYPELVSSGASQALMALCGAAVLVCRARVGYITATAVLAVQLVLDISAAHKIKAGHGWGLVAGVLLGAAILVVQKRKGRPHFHHVA